MLATSGDPDFITIIKDTTAQVNEIPVGFSFRQVCSIEFRFATALSAGEASRLRSGLAAPGAAASLSSHEIYNCHKMFGIPEGHAKTKH